MTKRKIKWGILSTAKIGVQKVIPAMQKGELCEIRAISSRNLRTAKEIAQKFGIPKAYGSYEEMLNDGEIEAVYNPLPNHLHVPWTIKAIESGKHVLCEKPVGMNALEAEQIIKEAGKHPGLKIMEAFMYRFHPQWQKAKELVKVGKLGEVKSVQSFFSYYNVDPENIRNQPEAGGGALMDIGCYCISFPRFIFEKEPVRVIGAIDYDPEMKIDRTTSGIMDFSGGIVSSFTCSTQLMPYQRANILGTKGRIDIEIPVNTLPDQPARILLVTKENVEEIKFDAVDQYTLQGDLFSKSILENTAVPTPLIDALNNMKVIDGIKKSAAGNTWIKL